MANVKLDLINKINNDKFYQEIEFVRLAQDPNMNYEKKIKCMQDQLGKIALINAELELVNAYLPEQQQAAPQPEAAPAPAPAPAEQPQAKVHQGQSHGEG